MSALSYLHVLSPLHTGTGQGTGVIDLPIARETTTNWPEVPGSGIKGALRTVGEELENFPVTEVFGPELSKEEYPQSGAGKVRFGGARILCFPARSYKGTFAWITCPLALMGWARDLETVGLNQNVPPFQVPKANQVLTSSGSAITMGSSVFLEEVMLANSSTDDTRTFAQFLADSIFDDDNWKTFFVNRFAIVDDEVFTFLVTMGTTVSTRIKLKDDTKTVQDGAMWYEETIPSEAVFWHPVDDTTGAYGEDLSRLFEQVFQLGGNATVGQGMVKAKLFTAGGDQK